MVRDFLSGIAMLMEDQYGPGDVVDAGPAKGVVERVGLRTTRLRAVDGIVWHVRNGEIERLGNESRDWARVLVDVEVARGADLAQARRTVEQAGHQLGDGDGEVRAAREQHGPERAVLLLRLSHGGRVPPEEGGKPLVHATNLPRLGCSA